MKAERGGRNWGVLGCPCPPPPPPPPLFHPPGRVGRVFVFPYFVVSDNSAAKTNRLWVRCFTRPWTINIGRETIKINFGTNLCLKVCRTFAGTCPLPLCLHQHFCELQVWTGNDLKNIPVSQSWHSLSLKVDQAHGWSISHSVGSWTWVIVQIFSSGTFSLNHSVG